MQTTQQVEQRVDVLEERMEELENDFDAAQELVVERLGEVEKRIEEILKRMPTPPAPKATPKPYSTGSAS